MNAIDTLIRDLEAPLEGDRVKAWLNVVRFAYDQGWYEVERRDLNEDLIGMAFDLSEENILLVVALSLVPEGRFWSVDSSASAFTSELTSGHQNVATADGATPALALCIASLRARKARAT